MTVETPRVPSVPRSRVPARDRLIVALDFPSLADATEMVGELVSSVSWFKVGAEIFTSCGPDAVAMVRAFGARVFLDLKYHDIPNTVGRAVASAARLGVSMLNVHIAAGEAALRAAAEAARSSTEPRTPDPGPRPLVLGVTVLTSHETDGPQVVVEAARLARACGLDGVVASARETVAIKEACGSEFVVVTPAIRPSSTPGFDQRRIVSPADAVAAGSDYLVIGRPITAASRPREAVETLLDEIDAILHN
jgi:orotidine-5'-phosphate decarboxylase